MGSVTHALCPRAYCSRRKARSFFAIFQSTRPDVSVSPLGRLRVPRKWRLQGTVLPRPFGPVNGPQPNGSPKLPRVPALAPGAPLYTLKILLYNPAVADVGPH